MSNIILDDIKLSSFILSRIYILIHFHFIARFLFVADFKIESGLSLSEHVNNKPIKMIILSFSLSFFLFSSTAKNNFHWDIQPDYTLYFIIPILISSLFKFIYKSIHLWTEIWIEI